MCGLQFFFGGRRAGGFVIRAQWRGGGIMCRHLVAGGAFIDAMAKLLGSGSVFHDDVSFGCRLNRSSAWLFRAPIIAETEHG
ncbi:hypothetical protein AUP43_05770 [Oceanibaculum pacificum]|uniref:Uncharacterized protein n=1 Tax=Oceanibaculum pacificum TaxID=580166 RepID=A0A154WEM3_9PROT|nr:hypothetical protein AUP43_05770 [Oceanibaculum pacificum]